MTELTHSETQHRPAAERRPSLLLLRWRLELPWTLVAYLATFMLQWLSDHAAPETAARFPRLSTAITGAACVSLAVALEQAIRSLG